LKRLFFPDFYPIGTLQTPGTPVIPVEVILECQLARAEDGTTMFVILWEYEVKPDSEDRFQKAYGPDGPWVRLFQCAPHFCGTQLRRDPARPLFYFTIDFWDSEASFEAFLETNRVAYEAIDRETEGLTLFERKIISFSVA
jgi:heme-degrading monooxygenase HmoA